MMIFFHNLTPSIQAHPRKNGSNEAIGQDTFFPDSRAIFITKALEKLQNSQYCEETKFRTLFFKYIETFRRQKQFVDVNYFLLYSGLESFARAVVNDPDTLNSSKPICKLLVNYGFDVSIERANDLRRSISTYTHLRNALFDNSELKKIVNINRNSTELKINDYFSHFSVLVSLVILKAVDFDDGHINWNSWINFQPFK